MARFFQYQFPALAWAVLIFVSSALPSVFFEQFGVVYPWAPKLLHILFFFFLCLFLNRAFQGLPPSSFFARRSIFISILLCLVFGTLDEVHQMFVASRHPRITDVLLDLFGATLMGGTLWFWDRFQTYRRGEITR